jgi:putative transposase
VAIHAWVFMTNHVHLLATPRTADGISSLMQSLGRQYVRYFNHAYQRTGTLWEGRFRSCVIDAEDYLLICQRYIELNPVRAGMVSQPADYTWSSFRSNGLGHPASFWSPHEVYLRLGATQEERLGAYHSLFQAHVDPKQTDVIRSATDQNMAVGNDRFKEEVARLTGRRTETQRRGRKPREMKL